MQDGDTPETSCPQPHFSVLWNARPSRPVSNLGASAICRGEAVITHRAVFVQRGGAWKTVLTAPEHRLTIVLQSWPARVLFDVDVVGQGIGGSVVERRHRRFNSSSFGIREGA